MSMAISAANRVPATFSLNRAQSAQNTQNTQNNRPAERLASGRRINSAADDAAGLAISQRLESLIRGFDRGIDNSLDMQNLLTTADGGLGGISDNLQRVRELGLQAQNGILTDSDRANIQREVDQLLDQIDTVASSTQFNTRNLLDGTAQDLHTASNPDGTGMSVSISGFRTSDLGVSGFDVSGGSFDLGRIDRAMNQVNEARAIAGASTNRLDYNIQNNRIGAENTAAANSRIADADMGREAMNFNTNRILEQYRLFSLRSQMQRSGNLINLLM